MSFSGKKVVTAVAWGLAFESILVMALAGVYGGWAGRQFAKGRSVDEVIASRTTTWSTVEKVVPAVAGILGLSLGLMGLLPGTEREQA